MQPALYLGQETCDEVLTHMAELGYVSRHPGPSLKLNSWCERTVVSSTALLPALSHTCPPHLKFE